MKLVLALLLFTALLAVVAGALFAIWRLLSPASPALAVVVMALFLVGGNWFFRGFRKGDDSSSRRDWGI